MWLATAITLFPEMFPGHLQYSIAGKAKKNNLWDLKTINIRDFAKDKHKTVDDTSFGGGIGMVMRPDVVDGALISSLHLYKVKPAICYLTPRGSPLKQKHIKGWVNNFPQGLVLLCGRYEGIDERVIEHWRDTHQMQDISIGDYILSGGEPAALTIIDACIRLLPGVLEKSEATSIESFEKNLLEFPQYTKPQEWNHKAVPAVLISGDHKKIEEWRRLQAETITEQRRPDLLEK